MRKHSQIDWLKTVLVSKLWIDCQMFMFSQLAGPKTPDVGIKIPTLAPQRMHSPHSTAHKMIVEKAHPYQLRRKALPTTLSFVYALDAPTGRRRRKL
jgi:hypothetical protein